MDHSCSLGESIEDVLTFLDTMVTYNEELVQAVIVLAYLYSRGHEVLVAIFSNPRVKGRAGED